MYIGYDGSMVRLASGLRLGGVHGLRWPAMGSEIVMEVSTFIRHLSPVLVLLFLHSRIVTLLGSWEYTLNIRAQGC